MELLDPNDWGEVGMAISFLGREICRPKNPKCKECVMNEVCDYFKTKYSLNVASNYRVKTYNSNLGLGSKISL